MNGGGTKTGTTIDRGFDALLDVTRLVSRVGFGQHTGVDRVELAYLGWCLSGKREVFGLTRVAGGHALLDRFGLQEIHDRILGKVEWGKRDLRGVIGLKTPIPRAKAESDVRRLAIEFRNHPTFKKRNLANLVYINCGHSNLSNDTLFRIGEQVRKISVLLHDVIPLEFPQFQRQGAVAQFQKKVAAINAHADLVVTNSNDTKSRALPFLEAVDEIVVSHLGIDQPVLPDAKLDKSRPNFVSIGTIEPRKNHRLLLDVWDDMITDLPPESVPHLHIIGRRGWKNDDVFARLDALPKNGSITEHSNLSDAEMWSLLSGTNGLLFPSFAEGYGLPSLEAAALSVPVICGDLAIHRELLGDYPVYVDLQDAYLWQKTILEQTQATTPTSKTTPHIPSWDEHFARVNQAITEKR